MVKARTVGLPASIGPEGMDLMLLVSGIPRLLQERTTMIKNGVEQKGGEKTMVACCQSVVFRKTA
jgi:hypothetical protein